jgi:hypothetical protein
MMQISEDLREQVKMLRDLMDQRDTIEEERKKVNKGIDAIKGELKTRLEAMGDGMHAVSLRIEDIGTVSLSHRTFGKVTDTEAAHEALLELGRDDVFQLKPNQTRLNALAKEFTEDGKAAPYGIEFTYVEDVRLLRARS